MRACDSCTTRKSAPFQVRANLEPLCSPLQAALRFFRILMPAPSSVSLAGRLPRFITAKPWRRIGFTTFPFLPTRMNFSVSIRLAPVSPRQHLWRRVPIIERNNRLPTFWSEPVSSFGSFFVTRVMRQFTYVVHAEIALPPHRTAAGSVDPFLVTKVDRPSGGFVVPEASHPIVTNRARSGRQLLVAQ
jgi:hypothetical protein